LHLRGKYWDNFEALLGSGKKDFQKNGADFPETLRELSADLNTAKACGFDPAITERLNRLILDGNQILYKQNSFSLKDTSVFLLQKFPQILRKHYRSILACHIIFYGLYFFFLLICLKYDDLAEYIVPKKQKQELLSMYDPQSEYYLNPREIENDADMFGFYIFNNISIAFRTFAGGVFAGAGSLVLLMVNAVFLCAATGLIINAGFLDTFFSFTSAHSAFELTGIILSAQAGLLLGYSIFFRGSLSVQASFRKTGRDAAVLMAGSAVLIFFAAVIEAFWSSRHEIKPLYHYASAIFFWLLLIFYFVFAGKKKREHSI
jgi:uncharacterized membrane protein SpoIIM required for sporulation